MGPTPKNYNTNNFTTPLWVPPQNIIIEYNNILLLYYNNLSIYTIIKEGMLHSFFTTPLWGPPLNIIIEYNNILYNDNNNNNNNNNNITSIPLLSIYYYKRGNIANFFTTSL